MIDRSLDRPVYQQLADELRKRILAGEYGPGDLLPSQSELSRGRDLGEATVRRAMAVLRSEGLVETIKGHGVAVRRRPAVRRMSSTRYADTLAALRAGSEPTSSAFTRDHDVPWEKHHVACRFRTVGAPDDVAEWFGVEAGTPVFKRHVILSVQGTAERIRTSYYPLDLVEGTAMMDARRQPWPGGVIAELEAVGVAVTVIEEHVISRMPTPEEAAVLGAADGVPVFVFTRLGYSEDRVVEVVAPMVVRADRYVLHYRTEL